jgi:hypothetical protein
VARDQHHAGRLHVEPVVVEPGEPRLATCHRPGHRRRSPARLARQRQQRGVRAGFGCLPLDDGDASRLRQRACVHEVDAFGRRRLEQASEDCSGQWGGVELGEIAGDLEGQRPGAASRELREEATQHLAEREVGRERLRGLRRQERSVDGVAGAPTGEDVEDLIGDLLGHRDLGLGRRRAEVWGEKGVGRGEERRVSRRLALEDVDTGAGEMAGSERIRDGCLVDDPATGDVQQDRASLHAGQLRCADHAFRRAAQRDVHGHGVRPLEEVVESDEIDAVVCCLFRRDVRVAREDRHLHRPGPGRDRLADLAESDDAQGPAAELESGELRPLPLSPPDGRVSRRDLAGDAVEQGERVLGRRDRVACRRVHDRDPCPRCSVQVDVIDADPGPADDLELRAGRDHRRVDLDLAPNDESVVLAEDRAELVAREPGPLVDVMGGPQDRHPFGSNRLRDEDPHAGTPAPLVPAAPTSPSASAAAA